MSQHQNDKPPDGQRPLYGIFTAVPPRYDLINRLFTWRLDERWRIRAAREILADDPQVIMDLCTGTGDLAVRIAKMSGKDLDITGYDYSRPMLDLAQQKIATHAAGKTIGLVQGDAAQMPYGDGHFDAIGIAFAFRNLTYKNRDSKRFLAEIYRVLKPGARFVVVESSQPKNLILRFFFRIYTKTMVYYIGSWISGNRTAYRYLANSVIDYYHPEEVISLLKSAGFRQVSHVPLMGGVAAVHIAVK
jgi:demethylmenaquinone methyltransferase/2-methoxy-6-polyprenyl-1,4-benzoquinol methylase